MAAQPEIVRFTVEMTDAQAWNFAQFLKRVSFSEFRSNAQDEDEAYSMRDAAAVVARSLAEVGYGPR